MIAIIVTACNFLMINPVTGDMVCKDFEIGPFFVEARITPHLCMKGGQIEIAKKWQPWHPNWAIKKFKCEERKTMARTEEDV